MTYSGGIVKVIIMRHSRVKYIWKKWYTSDEFDKACKEYDRAFVEHTEQNFPDFNYKNIYISSLSRSKETAINIFGQAYLRQTELIDEVPLRSAFDSKIRLPLWFWNFAGRIQWLFNFERQSEGRFNTKKRAKSFVNMLCRDGKDAIVVTHGFFMHTLLNAFKDNGFRYDKANVHYKTGSYVVVEK
nr:histidine phosphatase family protein [Lachnoanaerobaculum sp. Marseille-Q4761]